MIVDNYMSDSSENTVQNGVVKSYVDDKLSNELKSSTVTSFVRITQEEYDGLPLKNPNTLYIIENN